MKKKPSRRWLILLIPVLILLAYLVYQIPFVYQRLSWRIEDLKDRLVYLINPPEQAVFIPGGDTPAPTPTFLEETGTPTPFALLPSPTPEDAEPTLTPTLLPERVELDGVVYVHQQERWNYCAPVNLTMALNFWGWPGDRDDVAAVVKPGIQDEKLDFIQQGRSDKNVMPSEMIDFVVEYTDYNIVARYGGELELIKSLVASGFPVVVEKGSYQEDVSRNFAWLGHFLFTTGYDEPGGYFIVQDSNVPRGENISLYQDKKVAYQTFLEDWRSFNYLFMVVYPPERQEEVFEILGEWADPFWSYQHALEIAEEEIQFLTGVEAFFAWFNKGTSLVKMESYLEAAEAFDQAYQIYNQLEDDDSVRPWRMTWYQTTPYMAYYFSGRYQDVINLANFTLSTKGGDTLEESLYWRGLAHYALGDKAQAREDLYQSVYLNKNFDAGIIQINNLIFDD